MEPTGEPVPQRPEEPAAGEPNWLSGPYPASYMVVQTVAPMVPQNAPAPSPSLEPQVLPPAERAPTPPPAPDQTEGEWVPLRSSWQPSAQTWKPLAESWAQQTEAPAQPPVQPSPAPALRQEPVVPPFAPPPEPVPQPASPPPSWFPSPGQETPGFPAQTQAQPPMTAAPMPAPAPIQNPAPAPSRVPALAPEPTLPPPAATETSPGGALVVGPVTSAGATVRISQSQPAENPEPRVSWVWWPLVLFNDVFDAFLRLWGAPGRWFCGRLGRALLGFVGLLCLLAALGLVVMDGMGWSW